MTETTNRSAAPAAETAPAALPEEGPIAGPNARAASTEARPAAGPDRERPAAQLQIMALYGDPDALTFSLLDPGNIEEATLWLARCIYSETKRPHEQELVAWVVRNRVTTAYRGRTTYRDVVLDPYQFSAFNPNGPKRSYYANLTPADSIPGWQRALRIAYQVRHANPSQRPFSIRTRHFFSEQSMPGHRFPQWARAKDHVTLNWSYRVDQRRFRFYAGSSIRTTSS